MPRFIAPQERLVSRRTLSRIAALGVVLTVAPGFAQAEPSTPVSEIVVQNRAPLAFLLVTPSGGSAQVRSSAIISFVSDLFEQHTDLAVRVVEPSRVVDCRGRLPCLVEAVRTDYDRARLVGPDGQLRPFTDHLKRLEAEGIVVPDALLVLSSIALGERDRLVAQWIDTEQALAITHHADRSRPNWQDDVEARVREHAVPVRLSSGTAGSEAEAQSYLERLVTEELRPVLLETGHWSPYGEILISGAPPGAAVLLDGQTLGTTQAGDLRITQVRLGPHRLEITRPGYETWQESFELGPSRTRVLEPRLRKQNPRHLGRTAVFWGGLAVGAAGLAVGAWALSAGSNDTLVYCSEPCSDRFRRLSEDSSTPRFGTEDTGGVLAAPLGYSLALTGAAFSLGSVWLGDQDDFPWLAVLGGLAVGGAAYGISAALDPGLP